jgi:hypothetical protein
MEKPVASRRRGRPRLFRLCILLAFLGPLQAHAIDLSRAEAMHIGRKIWQNECGGTIAGLTSWNAGENFASLGIGHFIWYPKDVRGPFEESFPKFVRFAAGKSLRLPKVTDAEGTTPCPWNSRAEFLSAKNSPEMNELRNFLARSIDLQAGFLVERLQQALPRILAAAPAEERVRLEQQFTRVASTPQGCYALVDYVNFKGEGLLDTERYHGQGWGLFQVLQGMTGNQSGAAAASEFARSARAILSRRVHNSPPERNESRWLPGWLQRVNSYTRS